MTDEDRHAHYGGVLSKLLHEAVQNNEADVLLDTVSTLLGAMGSAIEDPEHRKMFVQDIGKHVTYNMEKIRKTSSSPSDGSV